MVRIHSNPEKLVESIKGAILNHSKEWSFTEEDLKRVTRKKIGFFLRALNSIEYIANQFTRYSFNEMNLFDVVPALEKLSMDQVKEAFETLKNEEAHTSFTIIPPEKNNG